MNNKSNLPANRLEPQGDWQAGKAIIAMSGGVDSSVAAKMLVDQGYKSMGIFLHFWRDPEIPGNFENKCCSAKAFMDTRRVCQRINITLYTLNFAREFKKEIVNDFINEYKSGNTPNPCVRCNKLVKLGLLIKRAQKLGYDKVASGHYVRLKKVGAKYKLYKAKDKEKDQSYFLWTLTQEQLKHLIFPLGDYRKAEVRKLARKYKLPVSEKKESQEVCFIPEKSHNEFLKRYLKLKKGKIKTSPPAPLLSKERGDRAERERSEVIGEHQGLPLYTIGQRRGVEIGGTGPYYVARLDYKTNTLYVVNDFDDPVLYNDKLIARDVNWISGKEPIKCDAVIRYRHKPTKCNITPLPASLRDARTGTKGGRGIYKKYLVSFNKPQRAITPGQSVVFYRGDEMLGGGIIKSSS